MIESIPRVRIKHSDGKFHGGFWTPRTTAENDLWWDAPPGDGHTESLYISVTGLKLRYVKAEKPDLTGSADCGSLIDHASFAVPLTADEAAEWLLRHGYSVPDAIRSSTASGTDNSPRQPPYGEQMKEDMRVWIWDLYPLAPDALPNYRGQGKQLKADRTFNNIQMGRKMGEPKDSPFLRRRRCYVPSDDDLSTIRSCYPNTEPGNPNWLKAQADLVDDGEEPQTFADLTAPAILALLRRSLASKSEITLEDYIGQIERVDNSVKGGDAGIKAVTNWGIRIDAAVDANRINEYSWMNFQPCREADQAMIRLSIDYPQVIATLRETVKECKVALAELKQNRSDAAHNNLAQLMDILARRIAESVDAIRGAAPKKPAGDPPHETVQRAFDHIKKNPGSKGAKIANEIGIDFDHFRSRIVPQLKKLGVTNFKKRGYCPPPM